MSDIQLYLLEAGKSKTEAREIAKRSAHQLATRKTKLIDIITSLEQYINNTDGEIRANTVAYLADVIAELPPRSLSIQERRLLCDFILGRLEGDVEGAGSSAKALTALEALGKWDSETAQKVTQTFLQRTHPLRQFKTQTERYAIVQLIDLLLAKYREPLRQLHDTDAEFMPQFISYWEGEKDPRNLMIIFSLLQVPMTEWDIRANAQDLFESVFNYFPITFKPPPDDPYGITAQDLKDRLRACIAANSDFAPYAFPQLFDKLDSTSMNTKRDVLQAIKSCIAEYDRTTINLYSVTLWDALKFEILNVQEEDLATDSLAALAMIGAKFANGEEGPLNAYLRPIIKECNQHLEDAPTKQSEATGRIIFALAEASPDVADKLAKGILPSLFALYHACDSITKRRGLLEVFNQISAAFVKLEATNPGRDPEALQAFADDALQAMVRAIANAPKAEVSFRMVSLQGLAQLLAVPKVLSDKQAELAIGTVTDVILHENIEGHGDIRSPAIESLVKMAHSAPHVVRDRSIPSFMVELPDVPSEGSIPEAVLEAFAQLATEREVFDTVVLRLKNKLSAARRGSAPKAYLRALLLAMLYAFSFGSPLQDDGVVRSTYYSEYAEKLIDEYVRGEGYRQDRAILEVVGRICNVILRSQGAHFQSKVYYGDLDWLSVRTGGDGASGPISLTPFLLYYYAALRPEVADMEDVVGLLKEQAAAALAGRSNIPPGDTSLRLIALLVNKFANPKTIQTTLRSAGIDFDNLLVDHASLPAIDVAFAVAKGLTVQGKSGALTSKYLQTLLDLLSDSGKDVAHRFSSLLAPDDILSKTNHCLVSGLNKQKVFNQAVPFLTDSVKTAAPEKKPNYLIAVSGLLRWLPYSIIQPSLTSLAAPLLQTLDLPEARDQDVKASALTIFESVLMHDPATFAEHSSSLITRLLNCTAAPANSAEVRARSLQCLALVPKQLKREAVVPYRRQVVKKLLPCLDDAKRKVRAEGVRCRTAWLGLDDGGEDDE